MPSNVRQGPTYRADTTEKHSVFYRAHHDGAAAEQLNQVQRHYPTRKRKRRTRTTCKHLYHTIVLTILTGGFYHRNGENVLEAARKSS